MYKTFEYRYMEDFEWRKDTYVKDSATPLSYLQRLFPGWVVTSITEKVATAVKIVDGKVINMIAVQDASKVVKIYDKKGLTSHKTLDEADQWERGNTYSYTQIFKDDNTRVYKSVYSNELFPYYQEVE